MIAKHNQHRIFKSSGLKKFKHITYETQQFLKYILAYHWQDRPTIDDILTDTWFIVNENIYNNSKLGIQDIQTNNKFSDAGQL